VCVCRHLDAKKKSHLSPNDLEEGAKGLNLHLPKGTAARIFQATQANKDGSLGYKEFVLAFDSPPGRGLPLANKPSLGTTPAQVLIQLHVIQLCCIDFICIVESICIAGLICIVESMCIVGFIRIAQFPPTTVLPELPLPLLP
jgi:hypothetical protein